MRFVKGLANLHKILTYVPNMIHICPNNIHLSHYFTTPQHLYINVCSCSSVCASILTLILNLLIKACKTYCTTTY